MNSMDTASTATAPPVPVASKDPAAQGKLAEKVAVRDLNFYYGDHRALKSINVPLYDRKVTAFIGPSGCGKSTLLRILNRIYDLYPNQRAEGEVLLDGENILEPGQDLNLLRARDRHGVPEADAVPDVDLREHRLRHPPLRELLARRARPAASSRRCAARRSGTRSRTSCTPAGSACRAASSSACASPAPSRSSRRSSCSTSPARRSTRSRPPRSRS